MQVQPINNSPSFGKVTIVAVRRNIFKSPEDARACYNEFQQAFHKVTGKKPANLTNILYGTNEKLPDNVILPSQMPYYDLLPQSYLKLNKDYHLFMVCTGREKNELESNLSLKERLGWLKNSDFDKYWFSSARVWIGSAVYHGGWAGFMLKDWGCFGNIADSLLKK